MLSSAAADLANLLGSFTLVRIVKTLLLLMFLAIVGLGVAAWFAYLQLREPLPLKADRIEFTIAAGSGLKSAALTIATAGAGWPAWAIDAAGRVLGRETQIKAGSYEIRRGISALELIDVLTRGDVLLARITLVEGKTLREFRALLAAHPDVAQQSRAMNDAQLAQTLGEASGSLEGRLLPETYLFDKGSADLDIIRRAHDGMRRALADAWAAHDPALPLSSPDQLLTLASMIEKETGRVTDQPPIASVFANRLRIGMPLQSDPTVIYGMGAGFDGNLRRRDLQTDSPWNTYTRKGLPLTPIGMPGLGALAAASRPPTSNHLYFVARGDGSSEFSATLDAHNRAVNRYQRRGN
jgi:UPF0755 protein